MRLSMCIDYLTFYKYNEVQTLLKCNKVYNPTTFIYLPVSAQAPRAAGVAAGPPQSGNTGSGLLSAGLASNVITAVLAAAFAVTMNFVVLFFVRRLRRKQKIINKNKKSKTNDELSNGEIDVNMFHPAPVINTSTVVPEEVSS